MSLAGEINSLRLDQDELKHLLEVASRPKIKDLLIIESRRLDTKMSNLLQQQQAAGSGQEATVTGAASAPRVYDCSISTYSWDQSDGFVKIYLTNLKNVQSLTDRSRDFEVLFNPSSVHFVAKNLEGKNMVFDIKELAYKINPEKSDFKVKTDMVILSLKKYETEKWSHLKRSDKVQAEKPKLKPTVGDDKDADPSASLMSMMKQLYDDGDDDMKRTIAKAWTESRNKSPEL